MKKRIACIILSLAMTITGPLSVFATEVQDNENIGQNVGQYVENSINNPTDNTATDISGDNSPSQTGERDYIGEITGVDSTTEDSFVDTTGTESSVTDATGTESSRPGAAGTELTHMDDEETMQSGEDSIASTDMDIEVSNGNTIGRMLSSGIEKTVTEQSVQSTDDYVSDIVMEGNIAKVTYSIVHDSAVLFVGVYDENTDQLLGFGRENITSDSESIEVTLDVQDMPYGYIVRAYIVDADYLNPLSNVFESNLYTSEMRDFLAKTTDNFAEELVVNFDTDKTTNYAVLKDNVIRLQAGVGSDGEVMTVSGDTTEGIYIFSHASDEVKSLKAGDKFCYSDAASNLYLTVKVKEITISDDGNTVTITDAGMELQDVFDYFRIDADSVYGEPEIDMSRSDIKDYAECKVTVTNNKSTNHNGDINEQPLNAFEGTGSNGLSLEFTIKEVDLLDPGKKNEDKGYNEWYEDKTTLKPKKSLKLAGKIKLDFSYNIKFYLSLSRTYINIDQSKSTELAIKLEGSGTGPVDLGVIPFDIIPGVIDIFLTPKFEISFTGSIETTIKETEKSSIKYDSETGLTETAKKSETEWAVAAEIELKISFSFSAEIDFIMGLVYVRLDASIGLRGVASTEETINTKDEDGITWGNGDALKHDCHPGLCFDGAVYLEGALSFSIGSAPLKLEGKWNILSASAKILDFYGCLQHGEVKTGVCPEKQFQTTVRVLEKKTRKAVVDAKVLYENKFGEVEEYTTGNGGFVKFYAYGGKYKFDVMKGEKNLGEVTKEISEPGATLNIYVETDPSMTTEDYVEDTLVPGSLITDDGTLWVWGDNVNGRLGAGEVETLNSPNVVARNVKRFVSDAYNCAYIGKDGSLWIAGDNSNYQLANGDTLPQCKFTKISGISDVVDFKFIERENNGDAIFGKACVALTKNGDVYTWGDTFLAGFDTSEDYDEYKTASGQYQTTPRLLVSGVDKLGKGDWSYSGAVITSDCELKVWGRVLGKEKSPNQNIITITDSDGIIDVLLMWGRYEGLFMTVEGEIFAWGGTNAYNSELNEYEHKYKITEPKLVESQVVTLGNVADGSGTHMLFGLEDGSVTGFGRANGYDLGNVSIPRNNLDYYVTTPVTVMEKSTNAIKLQTVSRTPGSYPQPWSALLTEDGKLYVFGTNSTNQMGLTEDKCRKPLESTDRELNGNYYFCPEPTVLAENVRDFAIDAYGGILVKNDGTVYVFGSCVPEDQRTLHYGIDLSRYPIHGAFETMQIRKLELPEMRLLSATDSGDIADDNMSECVLTGANSDVNISESNIMAVNPDDSDMEFLSVVQSVELPDFEDGQTIGSREFRMLKPDCIYNYYVVKDRDAEDFFSDDNILYVGQTESDSNGNMTVTFNMREYCSSPQVVVAAFAQFDIADAETSYSDFDFDGTSHAPQPVLKMDGRTLVEDRDYYITGDSFGTDVGQYRMILHGKGLYKGEKVIDWYIDDGTGSFLKAYSVGLQGNLEVNFYAYINPAVPTDGVSMRFDLPDGCSEVQSISDADISTIDGKKCYKFKIDIPARRIGDTISASLIMGDGSVGFYYKTSVREYAETIIRNKSNISEYEAATPLAKSLLNYGGYAETYFGTDNTIKANASLQSMEVEEAKTVYDEYFDNFEPVIVNDDPSLKYVGSSLVLSSETSIRHYFKMAENASYSFNVTYVDLSGNNVTRELTPRVKDDLIYVEIPDIDSTSLDKVFTLTAGSTTIQYSAFSYAYRVCHLDSENSELINLLKSLVLYNQNAKSYFVQ